LDGDPGIGLSEKQLEKFTEWWYSLVCTLMSSNLYTRNCVKKNNSFNCSLMLGHACRMKQKKLFRSTVCSENREKAADSAWYRLRRNLMIYHWYFSINSLVCICSPSSWQKLSQEAHVFPVFLHLSCIFLSSSNLWMLMIPLFICCASVYVTAAIFLHLHFLVMIYCFGLGYSLRSKVGVDVGFSHIYRYLNLYILKGILGYTGVSYNWCYYTPQEMKQM
jgi:hypothetical protein